MSEPENKQDVKRLLGMVNYLQRFAHNLSKTAAPLRDFKEEKKLVSAAPVMKYFDPNDSVELQYNASKRDLGVCLMQNGHPVAYASRLLTQTELAGYCVCC